MPGLPRSEFASLAAAAVDAVGIGRASGRVRVTPGERMLRYYSTQGVLDRPGTALTPAGKEARYGRRHLLQLVAIKRLQAAGATLPEIRERLAGVGGADLEALADLPPGVVPADLDDVDSAPNDRQRFWLRAPARAVAAPAFAASAPAAPPARTAHAGTTPPATRAQALATRAITVVDLAPGVALHIDHHFVPPERVRAIAGALGTMLGELADGHTPDFEEHP